MRWAGQKYVPNVTEVYYIWFLGRQASVIKNDNKLDLCTNIQKFFLKKKLILLNSKDLLNGLKSDSKYFYID